MSGLKDTAALLQREAQLPGSCPLPPYPRGQTPLPCHTCKTPTTPKSTVSSTVHLVRPQSCPAHASCQKCTQASCSYNSSTNFHCSFCFIVLWNNVRCNFFKDFKIDVTFLTMDYIKNTKKTMKLFCSMFMGTVNNSGCTR